MQQKGVEMEGWSYCRYESPPYKHTQTHTHTHTHTNVIGTRNLEVWCSWDRASWYISIAKPTRCTIFRVYWISLYMFRTVFPSITRSPVHTASGICHTGSVAAW